ncbi:MAG: DUF4625 domain-containing protein [Dysgonamonadaceae bacterium]|jgi:hypothetical protein|nr:DUF4625 domain-containing protein [Dysgonamonadaceae bacterium]
MKNNIFNLCFLSLTIVFTACDNNNADLNPPVITLNDPAEGEILTIGDEHGVHFDMDLEDDVMLSSYKIDIHWGEDHEHHHSSSLLRSLTEEGTEHFKFQESWDVSQTRKIHVHHHQIMIPRNAIPGKYHFLVYCLDAAGNESMLARNVFLSNDEHEHEHEH